MPKIENRCFDPETIEVLRIALDEKQSGSRTQRRPLDVGTGGGRSARLSGCSSHSTSRG